MRARSARSFFWPKVFAGFLVVVLLVSAIGAGILYSQKKWDSQTRFTVIELAMPIRIKSFDPKTNRGLVLTLPADLEIDSVGGRGKWLAGLISKAGTTTWAADSIADYLDIAYQGVEGELPWWDKLAWAKFSQNIIWNEIDLAQTSFLSSDQTPDGLTVLHLTSSWPAKAREWFSDQVIAQEALGVNVVNTTVVPGLGASAARTVESMGFKVRGLTSGSPEVDQCVVTSQKSLKGSPAVRKLLKAFKCSWRVGEEGDLTLELGRRYQIWKIGTD